MDIQFKSDIDVELIDSMGGDQEIAHAARVSTRGAFAAASVIAQEELSGLINYLMAHRHGSPFEHGAVTLFVRAPIFVWREWHRHRIASYNEESARYKVLDPVFYLPPRDRPMVKVDGWKPGRPKFLTLDQDLRLRWPDRSDEWYKRNADERYARMIDRRKASSVAAYREYQEDLADNIDPGLARDFLPFRIYSSCWVTVNPRSFMNFLSLRVYDEEAKFLSYPLYEIDMAAREAEKIFKRLWPVTYKAFVGNGRVAP